MEQIIIHQKESANGIKSIVDRNNLIQKKIDDANEEFRKNGTDLFAMHIDKHTIVIEIEWGDWKHDHGYADYVMKKHGFKKTGENVTEDDGSDCYSSDHFYTLE